MQQMAPRTHLVSFTDTNAEAARNGTKTRTRRVMNPQPMTLEALGLTNGSFMPIADLTSKLRAVNAKGFRSIVSTGQLRGHALPKTPYNVGDMLLVRESHRIVGWDCMGGWMIEFRDGQRISVADGLYSQESDPDGAKDAALAEKISDYLHRKGCPVDSDGNFDMTTIKLPWRPARFMWAKAVRTRLEVVSCTGTRLQDITPEQAIAEGIVRKEMPFHGIRYKHYLDKMQWLVSPVESFASLWDSIHGPDAWKTNPAVWDVQFKLIGP